MPFTIVRDDITHVRADAIVNAANEQLRHGGGVCGAIFSAAGAQKMQRACNKIGHCDTGSSVATPAFALPARYVIHTVGPIWRGGTHGERELLESCYRSSLELAASLKCKSIAFPLISAGIYGYPQDEALEVARTQIASFLQHHDMDVRLVLFNKNAVTLAEDLRLKVDRYIDDVYVGAHSHYHKRKAWEDIGWDSVSSLSVPLNAPQHEEPAEVETIDPNKRPCPTCGELIPKDALFCRVCGGFTGFDETEASIPDDRFDIFGDEEISLSKSSLSDGLELFETDRYAEELSTTSASCAPIGYASAYEEAAPISLSKSDDTDETLEAPLSASLPETSPAPTMAPLPRCSGEYAGQAAPASARKRRGLHLPGMLTNLLKHMDASFSETLLAMIDERGLKDSEVYKRANLSRQHFSKIRSNRNYKPTKNTVLALAVALELSPQETSMLLERAGFALSHADYRDVIVEFFINEGIYDVFQINEALFAYDQPLLG